MRTNIEIDDKLMAQAMRATGEKTKKAAVARSLETAVRLRRQQEALRNLFGKVKWEGDLRKMRQNRFQDRTW